jgi:hypothetical protein
MTIKQSALGRFSDFCAKMPRRSAIDQLGQRLYLHLFRLSREGQKGCGQPLGEE